MKKLFYLIIFSISFLMAKPCMIDIYFGNGVWNTQDDAITNLIELRQLMLTQAPTPLDKEKENETYTFKYAYNPSRDTIDDLIETFWQLYNSKQIPYWYFKTISAALSEQSGTYGEEEIFKKISNIVTQYNDDIVEMLHLYKNSSFDKNHNVLLVSHSQGNLFGNKMYDMFNDKEREKFRMVSVATPADHVMKPGSKYPYVTASEDFVIIPIPNSLPANVDGFGHSFIGTYLNGSLQAPRKIALYIKNYYDYFMENSICSEYEMTKVSMPEFGVIKIYGKPFNAYKWEEVTTLNVSQKEEQECKTITSVYYDGQVWPKSDKDYWTSDANWKRTKWLPGSGIGSIDELNNRSYVVDNVVNYDEKKCITLTLNKGSRIYNILSEMVKDK